MGMLSWKALVAAAAALAAVTSDVAASTAAPSEQTCSAGCAVDPPAGDATGHHLLLQASVRSGRTAARDHHTWLEPASAPPGARPAGHSEGDLSLLSASARAWALREGGSLPCDTDSDCGWHARCTVHKTCAAWHLGERLAPDVLIGVVSFVIAAFSLVAGVGGGGLYVPLLMSGLSFDASTATALSPAMLFGGAAAAFAYNMRQARPGHPQKALVDFELACLLGSALMAGGQLGSVVHAFAPPALLLALLTVVLADSARKSARSAMKMGAQEAERKRGDGQASSSRGEVKDAAQSAGGGGVQNGAIELAALWAMCIAIVVCKGLYVSLCTPAWWALTLGGMALLGGFALWFALQLSRKVPSDAGDLDFRELAFPLVRWSFLAGVLAAMCGIGGGMVMGPVLVELRVHPQVSSATTATTLLVLSSSTGLVYWCRGFAPVDYSLYLGFVTMCGAMTGKSLIGWWVNKTGRQSLIVWCLLLITVLSAVLMSLLGVIRVWENGTAAFRFHSLCHKSAA